MIKKRRPATSGQEREALIKMAADESELSRRTGNYKEQSTAGASARAKKYIEPVVDTTLNVTSLGGSVIGAAKMIPTIVKGAVKLLTPRNAAKALKEGKATLAPEATTAQRAAVKKLQENNIYQESTRTVDRIPPTSGAGRPRSPGGVQTKAKPTSAEKPTGKPKENIYEESKKTVDPIPPTSGAGRPRSPGGVQTTPKPTPTPTPVSSKVPTGAKVAAATVAASPLLVPDEDEIDMAAINQVRRARKKGKDEPPTATALKKEEEKKKDNEVNEKKPKSSFDSEPDSREDPSAWRKWNFKRVKAAEKAGVKPESIAKSSLDKEISERNMYDVSDKKGGRIKTSPKVKRAAGGMVKPKKKTSSPRGAGCAQRGYGKAMMGGGKVKAYKAGGKVGGNRLY
jgi:hypothetical protein